MQLHSDLPDVSSLVSSETDSCRGDRSKPSGEPSGDGGEGTGDILNMSSLFLLSTSSLFKPSSKNQLLFQILS